MVGTRKRGRNRNLNFSWDVSNIQQRGNADLTYVLDGHTSTFSFGAYFENERGKMTPGVL
jgi:hypothetical protein